MAGGARHLPISLLRTIEPLGYIDQYPIDAIKIDRSFVARMLSHRRTLAIIETIRLGQAVGPPDRRRGRGKRRSAKDADLPAMFARSGHLFAKPMSAADATAVLGAQHL